MNDADRVVLFRYFSRIGRRSKGYILSDRGSESRMIGTGTFIIAIAFFAAMSLTLGLLFRMLNNVSGF